jgi:hypothetical protein
MLIEAHQGDIEYVRSLWEQCKLALSYSLRFIDDSGLMRVDSPHDWLRFGMGGHNILVCLFFSAFRALYTLYPSLQILCALRLSLSAFTYCLHIVYTSASRSFLHHFSPIIPFSVLTYRQLLFHTRENHILHLFVVRPH